MNGANARDKIHWAVPELELIFGEIEYTFQHDTESRAHQDSITMNWVLEQIQNRENPTLLKAITKMLDMNGYTKTEEHVVELIEALSDNFGSGLKGYERALSRVFEKDISYVSDVVIQNGMQNVSLSIPGKQDQ